MLNAVQAPYALATPVVECVEDALQAESLQEAGQWIELIVAERERLMTAMREFGFVRRIWPSAANFFLVEVDDVDVILTCGNDNRVLLRYFGEPLADCIRISVGSKAENDLLLRVLAAIEGERNVS